MEQQQFQHHGKRRRQQHPVTTIAQAAGAIAGTSALLLAAELAYVAWKTPRLPPPEMSGHDFVPDGIVVRHTCNHEDGVDRDEQDNTSRDKSIERGNEEFKLVLLGDSPVEGIGNDRHDVALGGQTASAFARFLQEPVRYWSYGKSGLTAAGIEKEMMPLIKRLFSIENVIPDTIVISCGVNNTLSAHSADQFGREIDSLLDAIDDCFANKESKRTDALPTIILMGLLDFSLMPFLPFPLSSLLGWKSRSLQRKMEEIVRDRNCSIYRSCRGDINRRCKVVMAHLPPISDVLDGSRHDLLQHLDKEEVKSLVMNDFFADDGFHPAKQGTAMLGNIIARAYLNGQGK